MEKINEAMQNGRSYKTYLNTENRNVVDVVDSLVDNNIAIIQITVNENGEEHMISYRKATYTADDFRDEYEHILRNGMGLQYEILCYRLGVELNIFMAEGNNRVVLGTDDATIEIDDLIQKKSKNL